MKLKSKQNETLNISITIAEWEYIKIVKKFIEDYLDLNHFKKDISLKIIITATEMLENAVKYSINKDIIINLHLYPESNLFTIIVTNSTTGANADIVLRLIDNLKNIDETKKSYLKIMRQKLPEKSTGGGLGLARIYYELGANLSAFHNIDYSKIKIQAKFEI